MEDLLQEIERARAANSKNHFVILSDANDFFIKTIMSKMKPNVVLPNEIFTNVGRITKFPPDNNQNSTALRKPAADYLQISPFDEQTECKHCPPNLCKGKVLREYLKAHGPFDEVYYAGDGYNDFCPALELTSNDTLFARTGFR